MFGVPRKKVVLSPYNPQWVTLFQDERKRISAVSDDILIEIEHVGSTSVEGLIAKPIIDIAATYKDEGKIEDLIQKIESLGYEYVKDAGISDRIYFSKRKKGISYYHLHIYLQDSINYQKQIAFRVYLRKHPKARDEYGELKKKLYEQYQDDRVKYTEEKTEFILDILSKVNSF